MLAPTFRRKKFRKFVRYQTLPKRPRAQDWSANHVPDVVIPHIAGMFFINCRNNVRVLRQQRGEDVAKPIGIDVLVRE